jgi:4-hydroxybenzoyl-CoA thioesterase
VSRAFTTRQRVRFGHCDPAGIAFYPRYFEMCDAAVEDWCEAVLDSPRAAMHLERGLGLPTVDLHATFTAVSRLGDWLDIALTVEAVGRTSVSLRAEVSCEGEPRFTVNYKQVLMNLETTKSVPWPDDMRARLLAAIGEEAVA